MNSHLKELSCAATLLITSVIATQSSSGQDALGGGNALDANLSIGGPTNAARPQENYRDRNLIVTGDVAGGRGFRGSVGYSAAADFRGRLGSNDIFPFLADSAYSSPALFQLGTTYEQLRFGQAFGSLEFRRAQSGAPAALTPENPISRNQIFEMSGQISPLDRLRMDRTSLANSTAVNLQTVVEPQIVGLTYNKENRPYVFNASSLRGITIEPMNQNGGSIGLSTLDSVRLRQDMERGGASQTIGTPFEPKFQQQPPPGDALRLDNTVGNGRVNNDQRTNVPSDYSTIVQRITDRYAQTGQSSTNDVKQLQSSYQQVRDQLRGNNGQVSTRIGGRVGEPVAIDEPSAPRLSSTGLPTAAPSEIPGTSAQSPLDQQSLAGTQPPPGGPAGRIDQSSPAPDDRVSRPVDRRPGEQRPGDLRPGDPEPGAPKTDQQKRSPAEMANFLRHGQRVEKLSAEATDRFNELVRSGEERLRERDYFAAERRFDRALRFSPGHPMATAGMGHAQLGGGLYLSAALTLRTLLTENPEMIDTTFSADLLPPRERLDSAIKSLRQQLEEPRERASYGFLLAYIGHQLGDRATMQQGIDAMAQSNADDQLVPLLRELWLTPPALRDSKPAQAPEPQK